MSGRHLNHELPNTKHQQWPFDHNIWWRFWRWLSCGLMCHVAWKTFTDISDVFAACIVCQTPQHSNPEDNQLLTCILVAVRISIASVTLLLELNLTYDLRIGSEAGSLKLMKKIGLHVSKHKTYDNSSLPFILWWKQLQREMVMSQRSLQY